MDRRYLNSAGRGVCVLGALESSIREYAEQLGFDIIGFTSAEPFPRDERAAVERIRAGLMDGLPWYTEERVRRATHPEILLPGARSVISLAMSYLSGEREPDGEGIRGRSLGTHGATTTIS